MGTTTERGGDLVPQFGMLSHSQCHSPFPGCSFVRFRLHGGGGRGGQAGVRAKFYVIPGYSAVAWHSHAAVYLCTTFTLILVTYYLPTYPLVIPLYHLFLYNCLFSFLR
uniref:Uncharacterized protein n=1 Tax=Trypanosoma vivax (strain Y486) TaxID=1055687 RepID=G0U2N4_TRYVY|nr:hypothetical protein TVY486_0903580 [Trypanosoma vivax Y486]